MKINVINHAMIRIESGENIIYFDPFEVKEETHDATIVFITHSHFDHFSVSDIKKVINEKTTVVLPRVMENEYEGFYVEPYDGMMVNGVYFEAIPSYNLLKEFHKKSDNFLGYVLKLEKKKLFIMGDCDTNPDNLKVKCDYLFIPIGGTYTFDYKEAIEYVLTTKPKKVYPIHLNFCENKVDVLNAFSKKLNKKYEVILP